MTNIEEFEKWWCEHGIKSITEKLACFGAWQARQPEIDAIKEQHSLCELALDSCDGNINTLIKENTALKAEVERLNRYIKRRHAMMAPAVREASIAAMKETK